MSRVGPPRFLPRCYVQRTAAIVPAREPVRRVADRSDPCPPFWKTVTSRPTVAPVAGVAAQKVSSAAVPLAALLAIGQSGCSGNPFASELPYVCEETSLPGLARYMDAPLCDQHRSQQATADLVLHSVLAVAGLGMCWRANRTWLVQAVRKRLVGVSMLLLMEKGQAARAAKKLPRLVALPGSMLLSTGQKRIAAKLVSRLAAEAASGDAALLEAAWAGVGAHELGMKDGGRGFSSVPHFLDSGWRRPPYDAPLTIADVDVHPMGSGRVFTFGDLLAEMGVAGVTPEFMGRSSVYPASDASGWRLVLKCQQGRPGDGLLHELKWLTRIRPLDLHSAYPEPFLQGGKPVYFRVDRGIMHSSDGEDRKEIVIPFMAPPDYYRYLDDPALSLDTLTDALSRALHDVFTLARHGVVHTVPIGLFHNQEAGAADQRADGGRYVLFPELALPNWQFGGMGRLNDWKGALRYGNMGVSGLRDLEELVTLRALEKRNIRESIVPQLQDVDGVGDHATWRREMLLALQAPFGAALYVGNHMANQARAYTGAAFWKDAEWIQPYADALLTMFASGYAARWQIAPDVARATLARRADWTRLARQLVFFMTPAYVNYFRPGRSARQIPGEIYGPGTRVTTIGPYRASGAETFHPEVGWVGPDGDPEKPALGPVNGQFPIRELEKAIGAIYLPPL